MVKILKYKYSNLNVLFLDEIFATLHPNNVQIVIKILKEFSEEFALNIFVINHSPLPIEYFDNMIQVEKTNRFSNLMYVKEF
jgi:DNA repair exonuclease SbcCD ATPase subunit